MLNRLHPPGKKLSPPWFAQEQCLYRSNLIEKELGLHGRDKRFFFIEAQAGQGKTTLIQQYLKRYDFPFSWYQLGAEDHDPVYFVTALLAGLSKNLQPLALPQLEQLLTSGQIAGTDLVQCLAALHQQLADTLREDYCIVFDDLHLLDNGGEQTLSLLQQFVSSAPPHLLFFLASRRPLGIDFSLSFAPGKQLLHLNNEQLALTLAETRKLYQSIFQIDIPGTALQEIHKVTGGWIMGLVSFAHSIEQAGRSADLKRILDLSRSREHYQDYFRQEVFDQLPDQLKESLLVLSLLDEIPVPLAEGLTGRAKIAEELAGLQARNFFLRSLDHEGSTYGMHHLFGEYLRERVKGTFPTERIQAIYQAAANYYLHAQSLSTALDYFIRGELWNEVEKLLERDGVTFIARNQTKTLTLLLNKIPPAVRAVRGWCLFFSAIADNESAVIFSLDKLEKARKVFEDGGHRKGTLLALSQIIWLHMASTGLFHEGRKLLAPADHLFAAIKQELSVDESVMICRNIGAGALLFDFDVATSEKYLGCGAQLARDHQLWGYLNIILIFQAYTMHFKGMIKECAEQFEEIYPYFFSQQIGLTGKLSILLLQMNLLESLREDELYAIRKRNIPEHVSRPQMFNFFLGPFLLLWNLNLDLANGSFGQAAQSFANHRNEIESLNPHYQSQILKNFAYISSLAGDRDQALKLIEKAETLRLQIGGPYHIAYHQVYAGATYAMCGLYDRAQAELSQAIAVIRSMGNNFLLVTALMHRAWLIMKVQNEASAEVLHDLAEALDLSARNNFRQFRALPPEVLEPLLLLAVQQAIQVGQARKLIRSLLKKGVTTKGKLIPLLELNFSGGISIRYEGQMVCRSEDLPHLQRELLALLVAMPGQKIGQEQVQALLWPESPAEKARTNLDTLLSRLRTSLGTIIPKNTIKYYVTLQKGMLALQHCSIDILDFSRQVENGLRHLTGRQVWQAENCFLKALAAWKGPFVPEIFGGSEQVLFCRSELLSSFAKMALGWSKTLRAMERSHEAIDLLRTAVSFLPTDDRLIRQLYQLLHEVSFQQALKLLSEYRQALIREEYSPREIEEIIAQVSGSVKRELARG